MTSSRGGFDKFDPAELNARRGVDRVTEPEVISLGDNMRTNRVATHAKSCGFNICCISVEFNQ